MSKDYFVPLCMRVTHPDTTVTVKIGHCDDDNFQIQFPKVVRYMSFWKGPVSLGRLKGPIVPQLSKCLKFEAVWGVLN